MEQDPFALGRSAEEHRATPVETIRQRFREPSPAHFTLGAFVDGNMAGMATFLREGGFKERHERREARAWDER